MEEPRGATIETIDTAKGLEARTTSIWNTKGSVCMALTNDSGPPPRKVKSAGAVLLLCLVGSCRLSSVHILVGGRCLTCFQQNAAENLGIEVRGGLAIAALSLKLGRV